MNADPDMTSSDEAVVTETSSSGMGKLAQLGIGFLVLVLGLGAAGVIAVHNHPSGTLNPSQADLRITERLRDALALLDIRLLDHVIVAGGQSYSMAAHGDGGFF